MLLNYPFEENIEITKKVVEYAHDKGVVVEAELGKLAGVEDDVKVAADDAMYTQPDEVEEFVTRTGVDSLAIAIGTSHGAFKFKPGQKPQLRFDILDEITEENPGIPDRSSRSIFRIPGICKDHSGERWKPERCNRYSGRYAASGCKICSMQDQHRL